jgi:glycosyltransferase involved in cell wall biosynthesis
MTRPVSPILTIVIPAHDEASHLERSLGVLLEHVEGLGETYELIVIDDGSTDGTWEILRRVAAGNPRVRAIRLSRRFGKEAAICAGLVESNGRATVVMDSDLQHPPALIPEMYRLWKDDGFDIVEAVKVERGQESRSAALGAKLFYRVFRRLSGIGLEDATDFKLLDRKVVDAWSRLPERNVFFRGMSAWTGFRRRHVPLSVPARSGGQSQWSSLRLLGLAVDSITSFSSLPLYLVTAMGAVFLLFAGVLTLLALYYKATGESLAGFPTVIIVELVIGSTVLIALGLVGQYIAKIYEEVKARPRFLIAETTGEAPQAPGRSAPAVPGVAAPGDRSTS